MKSINEIIKERPIFAWIIFIITVVVVFVIGLFASSIIERKSESAYLFQQTKPLKDWEPVNAVWGENFPREYEAYRNTLDTNFKSMHGGAATIDYLEDNPNLVVLWAGYAFSKDYKQGRGHYYAIKDIKQTLRTVQPQPATCWACKSTDVPRLINKMGADSFYKSKWAGLGHEVVNPIGCQDCHDPKTMSLRITRPALAEAFKNMGKDITKATHQEMRSLVCAQCHVEYYFKGEGKYLTFPWEKGFSADSMEAYYDNYKFTDWVHAVSKAPMLKAQHPDFELYKTGIHADRGVSCADCHMPYKREGGIKITDHHIQSPLNNISGSCQVCHRESEAKLKQNVYERQDKITELKFIVEKSLVKAHWEAKAAWEAGATEQDMKPILTLIRHAQWRWDWVAAANGAGFHSPVEAARVLGTAIQKAEESRNLLTQILLKKGVTLPVKYPDTATKDKAQKAINLDMKKIKDEKQEFLKNIAPGWNKKAAERQGMLEVEN